MSRFYRWYPTPALPLLLLLFILLGTPSAASGESLSEPANNDLKWVADIQAAYTYSNLEGGDSLSGGMLDALLAASWKMKENRFLILKYDGGYSKKLDFYSDDNGQRPRTEYQEHTLTPMLHWGLGHGGGMAVIPSLFYTATLNKDTAATDWHEGLYNYYDLGAGIDLEFNRAGIFGGKGLFSVGMQYYKRHHPNFSSLLDLAQNNDDLGWISVLDTEKDEKDYGGFVTRIEYTWVFDSSFSWEAAYSLLYKQLDDKKVVDINGLLSQRQQVDQLHSLTFTPRYSPMRHLMLGIGMEAGINNSNQNYYDGMESSQLSDDVAIQNYYDYSSYGIQPEISYRFHPAPITAELAYSFHKTKYDHRRARTEDGLYKQVRQWDTLQNIAVTLGYELSRNWKLEAGWYHTKSKSNNDDQRYYLYDYTLNIYSFGISFQY